MMTPLTTTPLTTTPFMRTTTLFQPRLGMEVTFEDPLCGLFLNHAQEDDEDGGGGWWWALRENKLRMGHRNTAKVLLDMRDGSEAQREALMEALRSRGSTFQGVRDLLRRMRTPHVEEDSRLQHRTSLEVAWSSWTEAERAGARVRLAGFFGRWWSEVRGLRTHARLKAELPLVRLAQRDYYSFGRPSLIPNGAVKLSLDPHFQVSFPREWPSLFTGGVHMEWEPPAVLMRPSRFEWAGGPPLFQEQERGREPLPLPEGRIFCTEGGAAYGAPNCRNGILPLPEDPHLEGWEVHR